MAFKEPLRRLIMAGISWREYSQRFGQPCDQAKAAFRDADNVLQRLTPQAYDYEEPTPALPRPYAGTPPQKKMEWDDKLIKLVCQQVAAGKPKKKLADELTAKHGVKITRYHIAAIYKAHKDK